MHATNDAPVDWAEAYREHAERHLRDARRLKLLMLLGLGDQTDSIKRLVRWARQANYISVTERRKARENV